MRKCFFPSYGEIKFLNNSLGTTATARGHMDAGYISNILTECMDMDICSSGHEIFCTEYFDYLSTEASSIFIASS